MKWKEMKLTCKDMKWHSLEHEDPLRETDKGHMEGHINIRVQGHGKAVDAK
jgi:hypothetical protein